MDVIPWNVCPHQTAPLVAAHTEPAAQATHKQEPAAILAGRVVDNPRATQRAAISDGGSHGRSRPGDFDGEPATLAACRVPYGILSA